MSIDATIWAWKQQQLSPTQKLILLSMADRAGEDFTCWPSNARLCADTGLNRKTVYASIAQLIAMGLLARTKTDGATNVYQLIGVSGREGGRPCGLAVKNTSPKSGTRPEIDTSAESGTSPQNGTSPKSGQQPVPKTDFDQSQKRDTESLRESLRETPKEEGACTRSTPALSAAPLAPLGSEAALPVLQGQSGQPEVMLPEAEPVQAGQGQPEPKSSKGTSAAGKKPKEPKTQYGEFGNVRLTGLEYSRLEAEYGQEKTLAAIDFLDLHLGARKGADPYKSHYLAMRKWVFDAVEEKRGKQSRHQPQPPVRAGKSFDEMCAEAAAGSEGQRNIGPHSYNHAGEKYETPAI